MDQNAQRLTHCWRWRRATKTCWADFVMLCKQMHIHCLSMDIHELKIRGYPWITVDIHILNNGYPYIK